MGYEGDLADARERIEPSLVQHLSSGWELSHRSCCAQRQSHLDCTSFAGAKTEFGFDVTDMSGFALGFATPLTEAVQEDRG